MGGNHTNHTGEVGIGNQGPFSLEKERREGMDENRTPDQGGQMGWEVISCGWPSSVTTLQVTSSF